MTAGRSSRRRDTGFAVTCCAVLAAYNNVSGERPWRGRWYMAANACATGAALSAAAASGLTAAEIGLRRDAWLPGRLASGLAVGAAAGWLVIAVVPATRRLLDDKRITSLEGRAVVYQAAIRIPIGTVLWEEVAFRGVLQAALRRVMPTGAAVALTSAVFGIWHVRPTAVALRVNGLAGERRRARAGVR
ncbi:MAG: CPBP family intramembrane metalloprotease, partial [Kitasatospora sp.]|nr:CPBP family intramembrane metalloprotease [Kitasatospora sp.]